MEVLHNNNTNQLLQVLDEHLDNFIEEDELIVFHQADSKLPHIDLFFIKPNAEYRPYGILLTCGMSILPMEVPKGSDRYLEVAMLLPEDWQLENGAFLQDENGWPIQHLRSIANTVANPGSWVGYGHTFGYSSDASRCFPGTGFNSTILFNSFTLPEKFLQFRLDNHDVKILSAIPLYPEELAFKLENGSSALIEKFREDRIEEIFSTKRPNTCMGRIL